MSSSFYGRGLAASYRAGNTHIRELNRRARKLSAVGLTDKTGAIARPDKGPVPAPAQNSIARAARTTLP